MGLLTQEDATVYRGFFREMCELLGQTVQYQYPLNVNKTIHSEPNIELSDPIRLDIIFNENPTVDTLRKHGWVTEINGSLPVIAQIPYDAPGLARYARITIPPVGNVMRERIFEVTAISTILEYPDCWTVRLVPVYDSYKEKNDYANSNVEYLDTKTDGTRDNDVGEIIPPPTSNEEEADYKLPEMNDIPASNYSQFDEEE